MAESCAKCHTTGKHVFRRHYVVPRADEGALQLDVEELILCRPCFLELGKTGTERRKVFEELRSKG
jgi:hypothetical protein